MADDSAVITAKPADQPAIVNGFDRLTAATAAPSPTAPAQPAPEQPTPPTSQPAVTEQPGAAAAEEPTPYSDSPHLLPEHALLGSLLHVPEALDDLEQFLGVRDFSTPATRAIYATLRGLHRAGALFDLAAMPTEAQRLHAANENHLRLLTALRATPPPFTPISVANVPRVLAELIAAAPVQSVPFRGVYDPGAQLRLGRMVLEDSCRRQLRAMGVLMTRATPLVTPANHAPERSHRATQTIISNLERIHGQLETMTKRLTQAVQRTGPSAVGAATKAGVHRRVDLPAPRHRMPDRLRALSAPLQHRAERHILHLALHAGRMDDIPQEILNLTPDDFTNTRHANLWRTITDLQARGLPVNYVAVFRETRTSGFAHRPMPSDRMLTRMAQPPDITTTRVARSLRTLITTALFRATNNSNRVVSALASDTTLPVDAALGQAKDELSALAARANTTLQQHRRITTHPTPGLTRPTRS